MEALNLRSEYWLTPAAAELLDGGMLEPGAISQVLGAFREAAIPNEVFGRVQAKWDLSHGDFEALLLKLVRSGLLEESFAVPRFERPVFIIACPRSGSTLLFETMAKSADLWTVGRESHHVFGVIPKLTPAARGFSSNRLLAHDADPATVALLTRLFARDLVDREGRSYHDLPQASRPSRIRFLEKTAQNCVRVPFLKAAYPDALFIFLHRDPRENISSLMEGWASKKYKMFRNLPGWDRPTWSYYLPEGWQQLKGRPTSEIAAYQWKNANETAMDDLAALPAESWCSVSYASLLEDAEKEIRRLCAFAGASFDDELAEVVRGSLPVSKNAITRPERDKWRKNADEIEALLPSLRSTEQRLAALPR